jgi:hypothetical protein
MRLDRNVIKEELDMRKLTQMILLLLIAAGPATAQVTLDQWGTYATTAFADCDEFCDPLGDANWLFTFTFGPTNSGVIVDLIDSTLSNSRGDAFSEASVQSALGPQVRVNADSLAGGFVDGTGTAVQGYTYVGVAPDTIAVNAHFTGTIGNPDSDPATGLAAQVSYVGDANVSMFVFETAISGLGAPDGAVQLEQTADGVVDLSDTLMIPVVPGDQFYLVVNSAATAAGTDAFAESLGTLAVSFNAEDAANLVAASAPVAVPALVGPALVLLGLALGGVALAVRPKR